MSNQVTEAFKQQFADNYLHVAQQSESRLMQAVRQELGIVGSSKSVNRLGRRTMSRRTSRHADTPINDQPHSTRFVDLYDYEDGDMIDKQDLVRLTDPTSDYVKAMVAAANRAKDLEILTALRGSARSAVAGTTVALPSTQKIVHGGVGLTKAKIIQAKKLFRAAEADEQVGEELYFAYGSEAMEDVLTDTTLTSADFMTVQMLQEGGVAKKWCGFNWIPTELCTLSGTTRYLVAWAKSGTVLGVGADIQTDVGPDPGKGFNNRVYTKLTIGAVRVEEEKVVEVQCTE